MKNRFVAATFFFACLHVVPVFAQESAAYPAVVVTASRLDSEAGERPGHVTVITADDIRSSPTTTLPELLALHAGVTNQSLFGNQGADDVVDLRGFGATAGQNTLILLDGRRLNDIDLAAVDFAAIPPASIERIEIIRGGGAVLYGDGAVGGAINIITRKPGHVGTKGNLRLRAASYDTEQLDASVSHTGGNAYVDAFVNRIRSHGYRQNNDLEQMSGRVDLHLAGDAGEWFVSAGADDQRLRLPGSRTVDPSIGVDELNNDRRGTATPNDYADQTGEFATLGYTAFLRSDIELIIDGGYRQKIQTAFFDDYAFGGLYSNYLETDLSTWSLTPRLKTRHDVLGPGTSIVGIDYYQSQYDSDRGQSPATIAMPVHRLDIQQTSTALYGETTSTIARGTQLSMGARLQRVNVEARNRFDSTAPGAFGNGAADLSTSDTEKMLEVGIRQAVSQTWSAFAHASRSVRYPTVDELYGTDLLTYETVFVPLKPQVAHTYNAGLDYTKGGSRFGASVYRMDLQDEIHYTPHPDLGPFAFANENLDPTRRYGIELSGKIRLTAAVRVTANYVYTRAEFNGGPFDGNEVPLVPRDTASTGLYWDIKPALTLSAAARYVGPKRFDNDQSNTFQKIPGYAIADLKLSHRRGPWRMEAAISNALNEKAFDIGVRSTSSEVRYNAYPLPERAYSLSASLDL